MPDYQLGKIYKLSSPSKNLVYYGSTAQKHISTRIAGHIAEYNRYLNGKKNSNYVYSFKILECQDYKYELIEDYPCNNRQQLEKRESYYIKNNECVNKFIPTRTPTEYIEDNKEHVKKRRQKYYQLNQDTIKEKEKKYRELNRDTINENARQKVKCECGCEIKRFSISYHKQSNKHIKLMNDLKIY